MTVKIKKASSRLSHAELKVIDGIEFWTRPEIPEIEEASDDEYYVVEDSDRIDVISRKKYKRDDWWWVLAHRNNLRLLPGDIVAGTTLIVPRASRVRKTLF